MTLTPKQLLDQGAFAYRIPMRWQDLDPLGHLNNVQYHAYAEQARCAWLKVVGLWPKNPGQLGFVVASTQCHYKRPLFYEHDVGILVWIKQFGRTSLTIEYMLAAIDAAALDLKSALAESQAAAWAQTVLVHVDAQHKPTPLDENMRKAFDGLTIRCEEA